MDLSLAVIIAIVASTIGQIYIARSFYLRLQKQIEDISPRSNKIPVASGTPLKPALRVGEEAPTYSPNDPSLTTPETFEFSEDTPMDLPRELKIEIEGGDSSVPFGIKTN